MYYGANEFFISSVKFKDFFLVVHRTTYMWNLGCPQGFYVVLNLTTKCYGGGASAAIFPVYTV